MRLSYAVDDLGRLLLYGVPDDVTLQVAAYHASPAPPDAGEDAFARALYQRTAESLYMGRNRRKKAGAQAAQGLWLKGRRASSRVGRLILERRRER